ncbi:eCIS core domain-containing protein [Tenacibaculum caenipelagi]|uniref:Outer membrane protein OmpA-like peptidoglycan-associated protein n=1 Tax=Tenacibaculum caenipelagi TaxID=1325435 RepID=A0A4R6TF35_9FLAO|nr:DUF4157 domain-containing protein [Tenacibaculum caenipelagi]TDQ22712.1 outer membrane protein OmpA-like peptidoglycan-associated protein [Tenacibaculum caenipelagi]
MFKRDKKPEPNNPLKGDEKKNPFIQPKLVFGRKGDQYEVEADKMADKVVGNMNESSSIQKKENEEEIQQKPLASEVSSLVQKVEASEEEQPVQKMEEEEKVQSKEEEEPIQKQEEEEAVQSKCDDCEKEEQVQKKGEEEEAVQAKADNSASTRNKPSFESKLRGGSGGQKMDAGTLGEMESGFGADFSHVNIHNDSEAAQMSQEIGAQAFTHGNDIYFNKGKYNPNSKEGKHLLAHELTHTIQQKGMVQKKVQKYPEHSCTDGEVINRAQTVVWFERDSTRLRSDGSVDSTTHLLLLMREVRSYLDLAQNGEVIIYGYASEEGSDDYNKTLSQQRANRIKDLLVAGGLPEDQIRAVGKGESLFYENLEDNRRVEVKYKPPVTCMEFEPLPIEGNTCGALDCTSTPYLLGARTPHYGRGNDFKYFDFPSLSTGDWLKVAPFRLMPDGMLEFGMENVLRGLAGSDGVDMVNHFRGGSGSTWTHGLGSRLSREATYCPSVNGAMSYIKTQLAAQLRVMKTMGAIDCSAFSISPLPVFHFSFSDSVALKGIIGGTQGMDVYLKSLRLKDQATCAYEFEIQLAIFDDFGVDESDLYFPALIKFWILQHERSGNKPFINKLLVNRTITI